MTLKNPMSITPISADKSMAAHLGVFTIPLGDGTVKKNPAP
ncbi:hypothetical protein [Marivita sp. XM-24bin2]|nr:hypothetical protein [Marivita sp. XM-24bin2]